MRFYEVLNNNLKIGVSNEESALVEKIIEKEFVKNSDLNIREQEVARILVSKGVLERKFLDHKMIFKYNNLAD